MKDYGKTHCPYCESLLAQDEDYDKYKPEEGQHLCWNYPTYACYNCRDSAEDRLIAVLNERDELRVMLDEALKVAEETAKGKE